MHLYVKRARRERNYVVYSNSFAVLQLEIVLSSGRMHYDSRARRLWGKGRINGDSGTSASGNSRIPGHGTLFEEKQPGTVGFSRSTGRCSDASRKSGTVLASGIEARV